MPTSAPTLKHIAALKVLALTESGKPITVPEKQ
jgi:hypothetical protein